MLQGTSYFHTLTTGYMSIITYLKKKTLYFVYGGLLLKFQRFHRGCLSEMTVLFESIKQ